MVAVGLIMLAQTLVLFDFVPSVYPVYMASVSSFKGYISSAGGGIQGVCCTCVFVFAPLSTVARKHCTHAS